MNVGRRPSRWQSSDQAIRAVQVAFDVEQEVIDAVRRSAFEHNRSTPDEIRHLLGLPVSGRPKRPRLTVSLTAEDYALLAERFGLDPDDRLGIKEQVTRALIRFAEVGPGRR